MAASAAEAPIWRSLFGSIQTLTLPVSIVDLSGGAGTHPFGSTGVEVATIRNTDAELFLQDVGRPIFYGMRLLDVLRTVAVLLALHLVDRIIQSTTKGLPFTRKNGNRCIGIGLWLTALAAIEIVHHFATDSIAAKVEVDAASFLVGGPTGILGTSLALLLLILCAFAAAAVIRYGCDLEDERALTV